jgi:hypothetical protein
MSAHNLAVGGYIAKATAAEDYPNLLSLIKLLCPYNSGRNHNSLRLILTPSLVGLICAASDRLTS